MTDKVKVGVEKFLGPPNHDAGGTFYLVQGTDGGLYRMNQAGGELLKLVNEGDWQLFAEELSDEDTPIPFQEGLENLSGRKIALSDGYPSDYLSTKLSKAAFDGAVEETQAEEDLLESGTEVSNEIEDYNALPEGGDIDDLKEFMADDTDKLTEELQKVKES